MRRTAGFQRERQGTGRACRGGVWCSVRAAGRRLGVGYRWLRFGPRTGCVESLLASGALCVDRDLLAHAPQAKWQLHCTCPQQRHAARLTVTARL